MKIRCFALAPVAAFVVTVAGAVALAQQPEKPTKAPADTPASTPAPPRLVYTCPMHPQVVQAKPGTCPLCRMSLKAMKVVSVEPPQEATSGETTPTDHKGMSMPGHEDMQWMQMEHGNMSHDMCGCGMCMMMMGMGRMEMNDMEGMNHDLAPASATAKPAPQPSYSGGRSGGRGCGC
jgi:hypothetical protein